MAPPGIFAFFLKKEGTPSDRHARAAKQVSRAGPALAQRRPDSLYQYH